METQLLSNKDRKGKQRLSQNIYSVSLRKLWTWPRTSNDEQYPDKVKPTPISLIMKWGRPGMSGFSVLKSGSAYYSSGVDTKVSDTNSTADIKTSLSLSFEFRDNKLEDLPEKVIDSRAISNIVHGVNNRSRSSKELQVKLDNIRASGILSRSYSFIGMTL
jgi:hypothetical protein